MDYERFKEGFQDALKAELAVRGADVELTARRVDKMNESYDAITVRPTDSSIGVNISIEKAFASYENGTPIPEIAEHLLMQWRKDSVNPLRSIWSRFLIMSR